MGDRARFPWACMVGVAGPAILAAMGPGTTFSTVSWCLLGYRTSSSGMLRLNAVSHSESWAGRCSRDPGARSVTGSVNVNV